MNETDPQALIEVTNLTKSFVTGSETLTVLDGISAEVRQASSVVITGDSGSGKTTLLHLLATIDRPSSGGIRIGSLQVDQASEADLARFRNRSIGLIFQFHYLLKEFTALENVSLPARMAGVSAATATERAKALLAEVGLAERLGHYPTQLSGGERQRVALARALSNDPDLLLADEPTGNLDERNAREVEELLFNLSRTHRKTLLLVTHNQAIAKVGDVHWHLQRGRIQGGEA